MANIKMKTLTVGEDVFEIVDEQAREDIKELQENGVKTSVESVNGKTGVVTLDASDVGALSVSDIVDELTSTESNKALSARLGFQLNSKLTTLRNEFNNLEGDGTIEVDMEEGTFSHKDSGVAANWYGEQGGGDLSFGGSFTIPGALNIDAKGHITEAKDNQFKLPDNEATEAKKGLLSPTDKAKLNKLKPPFDFELGANTASNVDINVTLFDSDDEEVARFGVIGTGRATVSENNAGALRIDVADQDLSAYAKNTDVDTKIATVEKKIPTVAQEKGWDDNSVMSQSAVTFELHNLDDARVDHEKWLIRHGDEIGGLSEEIADLSVTPQMYGAVGDGVADDTQAINNALATGKRIFFPAGTYKVTSPLVLPTGIYISGVGGLSTIKTYITDGYVLKSSSSNAISNVNIENIVFENGNTQDSTTKLIHGNFVYNASNLNMSNCRVYRYYNVFNLIQTNSYILNCRFYSIYNTFTSAVTDSVIDGCYINASRYGFVSKSQCFATSFNSTTLTNCLIDYFYSVFAVSSSESGTIMGNTFNRSVNVFHDHMQKMTITNNIFTGISRDSVDLSVLTAEQIASLEAEKWSVIKFDNKMYSATHVLSVVTFSNNMGYNCDYFISVADDTQVVPADCEFRGNQISSGTGNKLSIVDVGFRNTISTENAYNSMHNVFFDFWDMKEYDTLPNATLYGDGAKSVFTFPFMRAVYNGDVYTNIDGTWVKGGGTPDLTGYATKAELGECVTNAELDTEIALLKAEGVQQVPLFANSMTECTDQTRVYVLPDGFVYGYDAMPSSTEIVPVPAKVALIKGTAISNGEYIAESGTAVLVIPVEVTSGDRVAIQLENMTSHTTRTTTYIGKATSGFTTKVNKTVSSDKKTLEVFNIYVNGKQYIAFCIAMTGTTGEYDNAGIIVDGERMDIVISADGSDAAFPTTKEVVVPRGFYNTGHAFVPADYESRIVELELLKGIVEENESRIAELENIIGTIIENTDYLSAEHIIS